MKAFIFHRESRQKSATVVHDNEGFRLMRWRMLNSWKFWNYWGIEKYRYFQKRYRYLLIPEGIDTYRYRINTFNSPNYFIQYLIKDRSFALIIHELEVTMLASISKIGHFQQWRYLFENAGKIERKRNLWKILFILPIYTNVMDN